MAVDEARREEVRRRIGVVGENVRHFFQTSQRAGLMSPLFNVPARLVLGGYCYFEHAPWILREVVERAAPEEVGGGMKGLCRLPNYGGMSLILLGYLNGREQLRARAELADDEPLDEESFDDLAFLLDFCERVGRGCLETPGWLPLETDHRMVVLQPEQVEEAVAITRPVEPERRALTRRAMAITELYTFILNGESRIGVFNHGPYELGGGEQLIVKELVRLHANYLSWNLAEWPPLPHVARIMRVRDVSVLIDLFGSMTVRPHEYEDAIVADRLVTIEDGALRPLDLAEIEELARVAGDAQIRMFSQAAEWPETYRIAYAADLYAERLRMFPRLVGLDLDDRIAAAFADTVSRHEPDLSSGADPLLVVDQLGRTSGQMYSTTLPA